MEAVIFIGIPGSGKSTFYRQRFFNTHLRISLDMLKTRRRENLLLQTCLAAGQSFVVDNTNVLRRERERYMSPSRAAGFQICGYFFEPQVGQAMGWNQRRTGKAFVPVKGLLGKLKRLERPVADEGFDRLFRVRARPGEVFEVHEWSTAPDDT